ncbi:Transcription factor atf1 [Choanephora cucurbitarum]|uniref:Transcription factor atf1 n=1 Tax=Choanephora cucurbitarum TaxID=101091 RepID=A0A1C7N7T8_9FUNG|nr:Transcription factor atf1 [Choanephora cucurbitarum]
MTVEQEPNPFEQSFSAIPKYNHLEKWPTLTFRYDPHHQDSYSSVSDNQATSDSSDDQYQRKSSANQKKRSKSTKLPEDEEKRKNFLERNRLAALKCRQRKKQWLNNLQARVEFLTNDNEQLQMEAEALRKEIMDLKTLLITHKDCPQYNTTIIQKPMANPSFHAYPSHSTVYPTTFSSSMA